MPHVLDFSLALDDPHCFQEFELAYKCYDDPLRVGESITHADELDCSYFVELTQVPSYRLIDPDSEGTPYEMTLHAETPREVVA